MCPLIPMFRKMGSVLRIKFQTMGLWSRSILWDKHLVLIPNDFVTSFIFLNDHSTFLVIKFDDGSVVIFTINFQPYKRRHPRIHP